MHVLVCMSMRAGCSVGMYKCVPTCTSVSVLCVLVRVCKLCVGISVFLTWHVRLCVCAMQKCVYEHMHREHV